MSFTSQMSYEKIIGANLFIILGFLSYGALTNPSYLIDT